MALDNAALLEVLEAMQAAGVEDRVRTAAQTIYQALIDAELTAVIGAGPSERSDARSAQRNGSRPWTLTTTAGDLELRIPRFAVVMEAYLHGVSTRSMTWSRRWAPTRHWDLQVRGVADLRGPRRGGRCVPGPIAGRGCLPLGLPRRHLLQGEGEPAGGVPSGGDRHRGDCRRPSRSPRLRRRRLRGRGVLDRVPTLPEGPRPGRDPTGHQ
jgi:Transposase, Mutator family